MENKLRIRPLCKYEITYAVSLNQQDELRDDTFTADDHHCEPGLATFYRTGNVIRSYCAPIVKMVITPVDDE